MSWLTGPGRTRAQLCRLLIRWDLHRSVTMLCWRRFSALLLKFYMGNHRKNYQTVQRPYIFAILASAIALWINWYQPNNMAEHLWCMQWVKSWEWYVRCCCCVRYEDTVGVNRNETLFIHELLSLQCISFKYICAHRPSSKRFLVLWNFLSEHKMLHNIKVP